MTIDLTAATTFMATHARPLDRRRFDVLVGRGERGDVLAAVDAYRNGDGGYGWGLEPDLRSPESQPGGALHAFEAFAEAAPHTTARAAELCDWLAVVSLPDGGIPFALPVTDPAGCAPFWVEADSSVSSLHITSAVTGMAHRVARHDPAVAVHPWLARATSYCLDAIETMPAAPHALEVMYVLNLLDSIAERHSGAARLIERVGAAVPPTGTMSVEGGLEDEMIHPLDLAPDPRGPVRALFTDDVVAADLARLAALQADDGGWTVDYTSYSPLAALEWRGYVTVRAVATLRSNGWPEA
jgi:hypothetical protein